MTKEELRKRIDEDKKNYSFYKNNAKFIYALLCRDRDYFSFKYIKLMRKTEYYYEQKKEIGICWIPYLFYKRKKNKLGFRIGLDMGEGAFDEGLYIAHTNIIVGSAHVGKRCRLHGQNCIGSGAEIGDDCELWVGAKVFGPSKLANGITVAAGAVVVNDFLESGITIAGVPARKIGESGVRKNDNC